MNFYLKIIPLLFNKPEAHIVETPATQEEKKKWLREPTITIDEFGKVQLIVGTIEQCDIVPQSEKLYALRVNCGNKGTRQYYQVFANRLNQKIYWQTRCVCT